MAVGRTIGTEACFQQPGVVSYPWVGAFLNQLNCTLNAIFFAGMKRAEGLFQLETFGALFFVSIVIGLYESFRPVHRKGNPVAGVLARAASVFLFFGQRLTAGFTTPFNNVFITWSTASAGAAAKDAASLVPAAEHIWSVLFAGTLTYIVPTLYTAIKKDYTSLSIWQPFPLYTLVANFVLPPLIRSILLPRLPFSRAQSCKVGTALIALAGTTLSAAAHWNLIANSLVENNIDIRDVFLLRAQPAVIAASFEHACHLLFTIDFASVLLTNIVIVVPALGERMGGVARAVVPLVLITAAAGPGAAIIICWAATELSRQSAAA
jgi:hypothetical protein